MPRNSQINKNRGIFLLCLPSSWGNTRIGGIAIELAWSDGINDGIFSFNSCTEAGEGCWVTIAKRNNRSRVVFVYAVNNGCKGGFNRNCRSSFMLLLIFKTPFVFCSVFHFFSFVWWKWEWERRWVVLGLLKLINILLPYSVLKKFTDLIKKKIKKFTDRFPQINQSRNKLFDFAGTKNLIYINNVFILRISYKSKRVTSINAIWTVLLSFNF